MHRPSPSEIYTLSLHDALPILDTSVNAANQVVSVGADIAFDADPKFFACLVRFESSKAISARSEERFSRNAETDVVCRLLLDEKDASRRCRTRERSSAPRIRHG